MSEGACPGFAWIGQPIESCDECGRPGWEHDGILRAREGLFSWTDPGVLRPWEPALITKWLSTGRIDSERAEILLAGRTADGD